ncbi:ATP-binding protein [Streptomyces glaucosporus]|uniref:ATP-binding protein n=1 Tax=Streptomyces glaucosporus TaxID=284044 RepID=A0ABN3HTL8_9ACTN
MERIMLEADGGTAVPGPRIRAGASYDGGPETIPAARNFAVGFLDRLRTEYGVPVPSRAVETVRLVVSELVTNVCKYAPGPCLLDLELAGDTVEITVWDRESVLPVARAAEPGRVGQHGLEIVLALCEGFDVRREPIGKRIKVRVSLASAG